MAKLTVINSCCGLRLRTDGCNGPLILANEDDTGCCCDECAYLVSISVIDEDDSNFDRDADWAAFRAAWPERQFFLLKPSPQSAPLLTPAGWDGTGPINVTRDEGNVGQRSDWYALCDLDTNLSVGGKISLFVDNSGSMTTNTVQASYDFFLERLAARTINGQPDPVTIDNGRLIVVADSGERWIFPHISFEDCPVE